MARNEATTIEEAFEREKWQSDLRLRERELALKEKDQRLKHLELRLKRKDEWRSRWTNPLVLAVLAATLAATGNAVVAYINGVEQREVEKSRAEAQISLEQHKDQSSQAIEETKAEATRILEVIKTNNVDSARKNLEFLVQTGLIANAKRRADLQAYLGALKPGEGPTLPTSTAILEGLGLNAKQIRAAQDILVDAKVPPERQAARLIEIAKNIKQLQENLQMMRSSDDAEVQALNQQVLDLITAGKMSDAEAILQKIAVIQEAKVNKVQQQLQQLRKKAKNVGVPIPSK